MVCQLLFKIFLHFFSRERIQIIDVAGAYKQAENEEKLLHLRPMSGKAWRINMN
jgi:hypothetical protein